MEATAHGAPEAERLEVTDRAALNFLDAVLGRIAGLGTAGQAAINRDPRHRSPVELEVVEAAKRPLVEHPIRRWRPNPARAIGRAMDGTSTRRNIINAEPIVPRRWPTPSVAEPPNPPHPRPAARPAARIAIAGDRRRDHGSAYAMSAPFDQDPGDTVKLGVLFDKAVAAQFFEVDALRWRSCLLGVGGVDGAVSNSRGLDRPFCCRRLRREAAAGVGCSGHRRHDLSARRIQVAEAHKAISAAVRMRVAAAVDAGASVVLSTGPMASATTPFLNELGIRSGRATCSNGAVVVDVASGEVVQCATFDLAEPARTTCDRLPGAVFVAEVRGEGVLATGPTADSDMHFGPVRLVRFDELASARSTRLAAHWPTGGANELAAVIGQLQIPVVRAWIDPGDTFADFTAASVSKASAAEAVRAELGVPLEEVVAVGDGVNDIELLLWSGLGVAMGQAPEEVRAAADEVCPPVEQDGAAAMLARWFGD
ncbi:HAD family phosphatase [Nocardia farcinica]|nr:HAD family hydrolase [Nocardia farcinica]MBF6309008.1 HAD family phosphatase [Nocardia farcinica]